MEPPSDIFEYVRQTLHFENLRHHNLIHGTPHGATLADEVPRTYFQGAHSAKGEHSPDQDSPPLSYTLASAGTRQVGGPLAIAVPDRLLAKGPGPVRPPPFRDPPPKAAAKASQAAIAKAQRDAPLLRVMTTQQDPPIPQPIVVPAVTLLMDGSPLGPIATVPLSQPRIHDHSRSAKTAPPASQARPSQLQARFLEGKPQGPPPVQASPIPAEMPSRACTSSKAFYS